MMKESHLQSGCSINKILKMFNTKLLFSLQHKMNLFSYKIKNILKLFLLEKKLNFLN